MKPTRRDFIKSAGALTAGVFFVPNLISCAPSDRLNIAVIGVGGQGRANWSRLVNQKDPAWNENIVALCDVDTNRAAGAFEAMPDARRFKDFRVMFDKMHKEIDKQERSLKRAKTKAVRKAPAKKVVVRRTAPANSADKIFAIIFPNRHNLIFVNNSKN